MFRPIQLDYKYAEKLSPNDMVYNEGGYGCP